MDRVVGSMLGLAIGDALGAPVEGMKSGHIVQIFGQVTNYVDSVTAFPDRPGKWRMPSLYTDDTQQALAVAEVLAVYGEPDPSALADLYLRLAETGPPEAPFGAHRGTGSGFRRSVSAMRAAEDPLACGQPSAGNGAAMRIAPVGLYYRDGEEAMARAAITFCLMTHHDVRGIAGALALARVVAAFARTGSAEPTPDPVAVAQGLPRWLAEWEKQLPEEYGRYFPPRGEENPHHRLSRVLEPLAVLVREGNDDLAAKTIVELANACGPEHLIAQPHSAFAPASVSMALYRALAAPDFRAGLTATVNGGGDADTVGAMAGAVLGARFGEEAIPQEWVSGLLNAGQVRVRGAALRDHEVEWNDWEDYVEMEKALTASERHLLGKARGDHRKAIEKRGEKLAARREKSAAAKAKQAVADPFYSRLTKADPGVDSQSLSREEMDPIEVRKARAKRGRKRISWKEGRRRKERDGKE